LGDVGGGFGEGDVGDHGMGVGSGWFPYYRG
jgi:hypothetical protein